MEKGALQKPPPLNAPPTVRPKNISKRQRKMPDNKMTLNPHWNLCVINSIFGQKREDDGKEFFQLGCQRL